MSQKETKYFENVIMSKKIQWRSNNFVRGGGTADILKSTIFFFFFNLLCIKE